MRTRSVRALGSDLNDAHVLRILPKKPLDPLARYVVVVTNGVKDATGKPLIQSPSYSDLTGDGLGAINEDLQTVKQLIDGFWENIATNYFQLTNAARPASSKLSADNIVISYSFTTSDDEKVLKYIASPGQWFKDRLNAFLGDKAALGIVTNAKVASGKAAADDPAAIDFTMDGSITLADADLNSDGKVDYSDVALAVQGIKAGFPDADTKTKLATVFGSGAPCAGATGAAAVNCLSDVLAASTPGLPTPKASTAINFDTSTTKEVALLSAVAGSVEASTTDATAGFTPTPVMTVQGTMKIPYYLGQPSGADGSPITNLSWVANDTLASALNTQFSALGLSIPQADPSVTTAVNYIFPFPKKRSDVTIPVLAMYPATATLNASNLTTVIFQHGITTDRSAALTIGTAMIEGVLKASHGATKIAVVAIDQPLHGVVPTNTSDKTELATTLLSSAGLDTSDATVNAVLNGTFSIGALQQIDTGCSAINVTDYTNASQIQTAEQTVLTGGCEADVPGALQTLAGAIGIESSVANAGSIVPGLPASDYERHFGFTADASANPTPMVQSEGKALNKSGSLFINLKNFLNNRDNLREAVVDQLNLRASIGSMDLDASGTTDLSPTDVYFVGHSLGAIDGGVFSAVASGAKTNTGTPLSYDHSLKGTDLLAPGGGIVRLLENSPAFAPTILGGLSAAAGLSLGDQDLETFFNVLQATIDTADPINFADDWQSNGSPVLLTEFLGDQVIPNLPYPLENTLSKVKEQMAPLSGTEPLLTWSSSSNLTTSADFSANPVWAVRYTKGTHSTPVVPLTDDEKEAFAELTAEAVTMILMNGTATQVYDSNTVKTAY